MMRAPETPQTPRRTSEEVLSPRAFGAEEWTSSPVTRPIRNPAKINADMCFSSPNRKPSNKENVAPSYENFAKHDLDPLIETPSKPHLAGVDGADEEEESLLNPMPAWVGDSPYAEPYYPTAEDEDKEVESAELRSPKVKNTFLCYSPPRAVSVRSPPNTVPPHFAPAGRLLADLACSPVRSRIFSPAPSPPKPSVTAAPSSVLRLADFLPDLPPEGQSCSMPAQGTASTNSGCCFYPGATMSEMAMPEWLGFGWDPSVYTQDMSTSTNVLQPVQGMEAMTTGHPCDMSGACSQSMSWAGTTMGTQQTYSQFPGQSGQAAQYTGMQMPPMPPPPQQAPTMPAPVPVQPQQPPPPASSQQAQVQQMQSQLQAQLQQLQMQLQQPQQPHTIQQMQQQIQNLQMQVSSFQEMGRGMDAMSGHSGSSTLPDLSTYQSATGQQVSPFSQPLEYTSQWSTGMTQPAAEVANNVTNSNAAADPMPPQLQLQQQLEQIVAGRVSISVGHFPEPHEGATSAGGAGEGASTSAAGQAETARGDVKPLGESKTEATVGERATRGRMGRMGRRR